LLNKKGALAVFSVLQPKEAPTIVGALSPTTWRIPGVNFLHDTHKGHYWSLVTKHQRWLITF